MFHRLGFVLLSLPPFVVFAVVLLKVITSLTVPVWALIAAYPLGILTLVIYSLTYGSGLSVLEHYAEFTRGARSATFLVFYFSVAIAILSIDIGEPFLGIGLLFVSLGTLWLPISSTAGVYSNSLMNARNQLSMPEKKSIPHPRIEGLFLALFLGEGDLLKYRWQEIAIILYLGASYVLGWVLLSQVGGFPETLFGLSMIVLVPLSSYRVFARIVKPEDRGRIRDILNQQSSAPGSAKI